MSESGESPQFGCWSSNHEGSQNRNDLYTIGKQEELEHAKQNNVPTKMFQRQSTVFSFFGSEKSSETSEKENKTRNQTPWFYGQGIVIQSDASKPLSMSNSSSPFRNNLAQIAELVRLQSEQDPSVGNYKSVSYDSV